MTIKAVLFDVIGTTVVEEKNAIINCFEKAFHDYGFSLDAELVQANRGRDKKEMIELIVAKQKLPSDTTDKIYQSFLENVEKNLDRFTPRDGAAELFLYLRKQSIKIGLGTGLSGDLLRKIVNHIGWSLDQFDYIGIPEGAIRSRPHPDMIFDMMRKLHLQPIEVLKVGDTLADIQEGKNAQVKTAVILAGTQPDNVLKDQNPDFIIRSLSEIKQLIRLMLSQR
jgi:phosphonatase-like hydrolase